MAFDCRSDRCTARYDWHRTQMSITMRSLSSVAGGPADPPPGAVRGSRWGCDTSVDAFARGKWRFVLQDGFSTTVLADVDWPASRHVEQRHAILHSPERLEDDRYLYAKVIEQVRELGHNIPCTARRFLRATYASFLRGSAAKAGFLCHTAMRVTVEVELAILVVGDGNNPLHVWLGDVLMAVPGVQRVLAAGGVRGFDVVPSTRNREPPQSCAVCMDDVVGSWRVGSTECGHAYHLRCINRWLVDSNQCPVCRANTRRSQVKLSITFSCPAQVPFT